MTQEFKHVSYFAENHGGYDGLVEFIELCNKQNTDLKDIARQFNMSVSQVCRVRSSICEQAWIPRKGTIEYIKWQQSLYEREIQRREEFINGHQKLRVIPGGLSNAANS